MKKSSKIYLLILSLVFLQLYLLGSKYLKTIQDRKPDLTCVVECAQINTEFRNFESTQGGKLFKNTNLSALIFLSQNRNNFVIYGKQTYSIWNDEKYRKFLDLWGNARFETSVKVNVSPKLSCHERFDFPSYDLNPAIIDSKYIYLISLYLNSNNQTNTFSLYPDKYNDRLIIAEITGGEDKPC